MTMIKTVTELYSLPTFEERYEYLRLDGKVGDETFGFERYFNQHFYHSPEWRRIRDKVIIRDGGCDLGVEDYTIYGKVIIHHLNPITMDDIENRSDTLLDPEFLICTSHKTHQAIHYGTTELLPRKPNERQPNDTIPWRT